jgi:hypothetical protein
MATEAQVVANRSNARKSTGPRTPQGKAAVGQNAVKHGLSGRLDVIKGENQAEFDLQHEAMLGELAPVGPMESMLAERVVRLSWRLNRVERTQNEVFDALLADRNSPLAKLVRSLEPKGAGRTEGEPESEGDLDLGRVVIKDFSNSRVLDRLLMYERRMEHSLYKTMAELQRLRLLRELDAPTKEPVGSGPARAVARASRPWKTRQGQDGLATEPPHGVTTNAPAAADEPHHSHIPSFQHSIPASSGTGEEERLTASLQTDESCKTKPIYAGAKQGQLPDGTGVREDSPQSGLGETKPISACQDERGAAGPQDAGTHLQHLSEHIQFLVAGSV